MSSENLVRFLEARFSAFQGKHRQERWDWSRPEVVEALADLQSHRLVEIIHEGLLHLTALGFGGETAIEVASVIGFGMGRNCLGLLAPAAVSYPSINAVQ
jgi:helicase